MNLDRIDYRFDRVEKRIDKRFYQLVCLMLACTAVLLVHDNPHVADFVVNCLP